MAYMGDYPLMVNSMTEVIFKNSKGEWPRTERLDQESRFGVYCIGYFQKDGVKGGTGSIIRLLPAQSNEFALVLTSAHVFIRDFQYLKEATVFRIGREKFQAVPIRNDLNWSLFFKDSLSGVNLSVPDDWMVCSLHKIPNKTYSQNYTVLDIYDTSCALPHDIDIEVHGFPLTPSLDKLSYIAPESLRMDLKDVKEAVWNGLSLICTKGKVLAESEVIAISCPTANGMSGSPVIINTPSGPQIVGILFGGAATKLHYYCALIIHFGDQADPILHIKLLKHIRKHNSQITHHFSLWYLENFSILSDQERSEYWEMLGYIYTAAIKLEKNRIMWKYNNAISIRAIWSDLTVLLNNF